MRRKQLVTGAVFAAAVLFPLAAWSQYGMPNSNFVSIGTSSLPAGQYLMSNLATGQSLFVVVNAQGQMSGQDPRAIQVALQPAQGGNFQTGGTGIPTTGGSGFGGMLKQGLDSLIQNKFSQPQGQ